MQRTMAAVTDPELYDDGQFHLRIRHQRRLQGLNKKEAAGKAGVTPRTYNNWEAGRTVPREGKQLRALADYYRVSPLWLLTGEEEEA
jgi:transcriptional regulator with XRE-family HTH domain